MCRIDKNHVDKHPTNSTNARKSSSKTKVQSQRKSRMRYVHQKPIILMEAVRKLNIMERNSNQIDDTGEGRMHSHSLRKIGSSRFYSSGVSGFHSSFSLFHSFSALFHALCSADYFSYCAYLSILIALAKTKKFNSHCDQPHLYTIQHDLTAPLPTFFLFQLTDRYYYAANSLSP